MEEQWQAKLSTLEANHETYIQSLTGKHQQQLDEVKAALTERVRALEDQLQVGCSASLLFFADCFVLAPAFRTVQESKHANGLAAEELRKKHYSELEDAENELRQQFNQRTERLQQETDDIIQRYEDELCTRRAAQVDAESKVESLRAQVAEAVGVSKALAAAESRNSVS